MPIKVDCPRCKKVLSVPSRKAGSYALCPNCRGRFWVPQDVPSEREGVPAPEAGVGAATGTPPGPSVAAPPGMSPPGAASSVAPPAGVVSVGPLPPSVIVPGGPASPPWPPVVPTPEAVAPRVGSVSLSESARPGATALVGLPTPPAAAWTRNLPAPPVPGARAQGVVPSPPPLPVVAPGRKVARLITAEAAESPLKLAADGRLPELQLGEGEVKDSVQNARKGMNPLALLALMAISVVTSLVLVLAPAGVESGGKAREREKAREEIREKYFSDMESPGPDRPYQLKLREAQIAHSHHDLAKERKLYREVLDQLRAERADYDKGLTGTPQSDRDLEKNLLILLSD